MKSFLLLLVMVLLVSSCAGWTPMREYQVNPAATIPATFDDVWTAAVDAFAERNWPIDNIDKDSGIVSTDWMTMTPADSIADCGQPGDLQWLETTRVKFNVVVRPQGDGASTLTVNTRAEGRACYGDHQCGQMFQCNSTGKIEGWFHETVRTKVERTS